MNFFDYVKLIELGWDPMPPGDKWETVRGALSELAAVKRGAAQTDGAARLEAYIAKMDKEFTDGNPVE